ncbi:MAG: hypothetical protein ACK57U_10650 [Planctomycetota bacterium]
MEKMKPFLNFLKKNWFWLSSGLMAILLCGAWFLAASALQQAQETDTQALNGKITELENVLKTSADGLDPSVKAHPNDLSKEGMDQRLDAGSKAVIDAWKLRFEAQQPIMVWPEEVLKSPEFVKFFARFSPPEAYEKIPQESVSTYLQMYTREIPKRMPEICKIIGTKWDAEEAEKALETVNRGKDEQGGRREGGAGGGPTAASSTDLGKQGSVVLWNKENQKLWLEKLTKFEGFDGNTQKFATAYQAFALQQDLWLLEAMFKVIKQVNGDADANDLAAIREIDHIAFGREARANLAVLSEVDARLADASVTDSALAAGAAGSATAGGMPSEDEIRKNDPFSAPPAAGGEGGGAAVFEKEPPAGFEALGPFQGRYVNANNEPISVKDVHDVLKLASTGLPEQNLELLVAKRVPVRIALKMQENRIPAFIAACANSAFGFEINQVRVNRHKPGEGIELNGGAKAKSGGGGGGRDGSDRPSVGVGGGQGGGSGLDGGGSESEAPSGGAGSGSNGPMIAERRTNLIVDVEFSGIVKIYNPVNEARLKPAGDSADGAATAASGTARPGSGRP